MWWGTVGVVGASFVGIVMGGAVVVGMAVGKGDVYNPLDFITTQLVVIVGVTHILTILLVILTGVLALRCLSPHFPPSITPRHTTLLFVTAFLSIFFTTFRLFTSVTPVPRASFISILTMGELILLTCISCLPSTLIAKASSLHGHLTLISNPPSPSAQRGNDRNFRHLSVLTEKTKVTARDFGYRVDHVPLSSHAQGDLNDPSHRIPSAPLFVDPELDRHPRKPEKVQLRPTWDEKDASLRIGVSDGSSEGESSSDEEAGRQRWISGRRSARIGGLRSGFEEGRDWRRGGGDEVNVFGGLREPGPGSAGRWRTPRTPRGFV
ncbi:hypothetical protein BGX38DRAFT_174629 [Terfezia claveryi]|nr:hypothetical protein BGX38DRAFT_174629 [Terfezia claveryi]